MYLICSWLEYQNSRPLAPDPRPLNPYTFLQRVNTSGVKIRPVLKNWWYLFQNVENVKNWYAIMVIICENSYSLHRRCLSGFWIGFGFWICQASEYTRALNVPLVLNTSGFWIYQCSEYTRVLNMPGSCIYQDSEYARITQHSNYAWIIPE